jgi:hypothetical protein
MGLGIPTTADHDGLQIGAILAHVVPLAGAPQGSLAATRAMPDDSPRCHRDLASGAAEGDESPEPCKRRDARRTHCRPR